MTLEFRNLEPLHGYQHIPVYLNQPATAEQSDVYPLREVIRSLSSLTDQPLSSPPILLEHAIHWTLVEGNYCGRFAPPRRRDVPKPARTLERSLSSPYVGNPHFELPRPAITAGTDPPQIAAHNQSADDILSADQQRFFLESINLLRNDIVHSKELCLGVVATEQKMQPLVPYFLQWIFGKMTLNLGNFAEMSAILGLAFAIARNQSVDVGLYAHSFIQIGMTGLLAFAQCTKEFIDNNEIQAVSARLLRVVADRCESAFLSVRDALANAFVEALMNPEISLSAHYGALLGIAELKIGIDRKHLEIYLAAVRDELRSNDPHQFLWASLVVGLLKEMRLGESV